MSPTYRQRCRKKIHVSIHLNKLPFRSSRIIRVPTLQWQDLQTVNRLKSVVVAKVSIQSENEICNKHYSVKMYVLIEFLWFTYGNHPELNISHIDTMQSFRLCFVITISYNLHSIIFVGFGFHQESLSINMLLL